MKRYINLVKELAWSDFKVRYIRTKIGLFWSIARPFLMLVSLYFVFSILFGFKTQNYVLLLLLGIILWNFFFDTTLTGMANLIGKREIIKKIYFPISSIITASCLQIFMTLVINLFIFFIFLVVGGVKFNLYFLLFPLVLINLLMFSLGISYILSAFNALYRDVNYGWQAILQLIFWISPIVYPASIVPKKYLFLYMLNPLARLINESRDILLFNLLPLKSISITFLLSVATLIIGYLIFKKMTQRIVEEI